MIPNPPGQFGTWGHHRYIASVLEQQRLRWRSTYPVLVAGAAVAAVVAVVLAWWWVAVTW